MNKKSKFLKPEADIVKFNDEDIIVTSGNPLWGGDYDIGGGNGGDVPHE